MTAAQNYCKKKLNSSFSQSWSITEQTNQDESELSHQILDPLGKSYEEKKTTCGVELQRETSGWRYGESQVNQWFNLLRHALKCLEGVVLDRGLDVPSFCRARCGQQREGEGVELQSDVAEGLCIHTKGEKTGGAT